MNRAINWWMVGYRAAMTAARASDFDIAIREAPEGIGKELNRRAWFAGWHSVWKCERAGETPPALED